MQRIKILDSIRGLCIILMIYHHITFLMMNFGFLIETPFYNVAVGFLQSGVYAVINFCYVSTFFVIAGITSNFSRNNFKRALPVIGVAVAVTVVTFIVMPNEYIKFGVLHCMAVCILAYALIDKFFKKVFDKIPFYIFVILFLVFYFLYKQNFTIAPIYLFDIEIPTYIIGLPSSSFVSADYYPIFPWIFAFLTGASFGKYLKKAENRPKIYDVNIPFLSFVGKYPLIIYAVHQPIALAILFCLDQLIK